MKINLYHRKILGCIQERLNPGSLVLDAGCGAGAMTSLLAKAGYRVVGADRVKSSEMQQLALNKPNVDYLQMELSQDSFPFFEQSFDAVVLLEVFEHLANPWAFLKAVAEIIGNQGWLFLSMPNYWNLKYRMRYLLTGNIQQPFPSSQEMLDKLRHGPLPHVNTMPWPVLKKGLEANGFAIDLNPFPEKIYPLLRNLPYYPLLSCIWSSHLFSSQKRKAKYKTRETNTYPLLMGGPHALVVACKEPQRIND